MIWRIIADLWRTGYGLELIGMLPNLSSNSWVLEVWLAMRLPMNAIAFPSFYFGFLIKQRYRILI